MWVVSGLFLLSHRSFKYYSPSIPSLHSMVLFPVFMLVGCFGFPFGLRKTLAFCRMKLTLLTSGVSGNGLRTPRL